MKSVFLRLPCHLWLFCLALGWLLPHRLALAAGDPAYSADVPVTSQSEEERSAGFRAALGQVLARLSGDAGITSRSDVAKALSQAASMLQQYQYVRGNESGAETPHFLLSAQFDPAAVDELMRRLHLGNTVSASTGDSAGSSVEQGGSVRVWISGMHSATDYAHAMAALSGSDSVLGATPQRTHGDGLLVLVKLRSSVARLLENLAAAQTLVPLPDARGADGSDLQLAFRP